MKGMFDGVQKSQNMETHKHICYISKFNGMLMVFVCMYKFMWTQSPHSHLHRPIIPIYNKSSKLLLARGIFAADGSGHESCLQH